MRFITADEARSWTKKFGVLDQAGRPQVPAPDHATLKVVFEREPGHRLFYLAQQVVAALGYFEECLLWVTQSGIWASSENLHLYYRLRASYSEHSFIDEKPAVRVLRHEAADLCTLVHLGILFGWDMFLATSHDYGRAFVSHDGWMQVSEVTPSAIPELSDWPKPR